MTTKTIEEQLEEAKQIAQDAERKRIQLETKLESVQTEKQNLLAKCQQLNVTPETLPDKIAELKQSIDEGMAKLAELLPKEQNDDTDLPY